MGSGVWSVEGRVWSVKCRVWGVEWSVKCKCIPVEIDSMGLDPPCCRHRMWGIKKILQNGWAPGNVIDTKWQGSCSSQTPRYRHPFCRGQNVHDPMVAPRIKEPFCRPPPLQNPSAKAHLSFSQAPHFVERYHFVGINRSSIFVRDHV